MYTDIILEGIIIKSINVGEYDRRLTIFTKEKGKIFAFARGARKANSSLLAMTRPFSYGKFTLYEGRDSYNVKSASISNYFMELSEDIEKTCYATYILELLDYFTREYLREIEYLKLTYLAFLAIKKASIPLKLIRRIYELRAMVIFGQYDSEIETKNQGVLYTWNFVTKSKVEDLFSFTLKEEVLVEFESLVESNLLKYVDKKMNSLEILDIFTT